MKILTAKNLNKKITPKLARKISNSVLPVETTYQDCLNDVYLRAKRGRYYTIMQQVSDSVIDELLLNNWDIKVMNKNPDTKKNLIRINW